MLVIGFIEKKYVVFTAAFLFFTHLFFVDKNIATSNNG